MTGICGACGPKKNQARRCKSHPSHYVSACNSTYERHWNERSGDTIRFGFVYHF
jgi:hypothetical protein